MSFPPYTFSLLSSYLLLIRRVLGVWLKYGLSIYYTLQPYSNYTQTILEGYSEYSLYMNRFKGGYGVS